MQDKTLRRKIEYYCRQYYNTEFLNERMDKINRLIEIKNNIASDMPGAKSPILTDMPGAHNYDSSAVESYVIKKEEKILSINEAIQKEIDKMEHDLYIINRVDDMLKELPKLEYDIFIYKYKMNKSNKEIQYLAGVGNKYYFEVMNNIYAKVIDFTAIQ